MFAYCRAEALPYKTNPPIIPLFQSGKKRDFIRRNNKD
jgi:hypothetical protein